jgi:hypothetical protein
MGALNIYQRMAAVMTAVRGVAKTQKNTQGGGYLYAGHERVTEALREEYVKHGILRTASISAVRRDGGSLSCDVLVSWINVENPEDRYSVTMLGESGPLTKSGVLSSVQAGIALSYAVKNAEFKAFSLTGDDTPDAEERDDQVPEKVAEFVERFESAETLAEVEQISAEVREAGAAVANERTRLLEARSSAMRRVRQS